MTDVLGQTAQGREGKARKPPGGVFALRCTVTRQIWVDGTPNLAAAKNGLWFFLENGLHRDPTLQTAWRTHGENAFRYEVLETVEECVRSAAGNPLDGKIDEWAIKVKGRRIGG